MTFFSEIFLYMYFKKWTEILENTYVQILILSQILSQSHYCVRKLILFSGC